MNLSISFGAHSFWQALQEVVLCARAEQKIFTFPSPMQHFLHVPQYRHVQSQLEYWSYHLSNSDFYFFRKMLAFSPQVSQPRRAEQPLSGWLGATVFTVQRLLVTFPHSSKLASSSFQWTVLCLSLGHSLEKNCELTAG